MRYRQWDNLDVQRDSRPFLSDIGLMVNEAHLRHLTRGFTHVGCVYEKSDFFIKSRLPDPTIDVPIFVAVSQDISEELVTETDAAKVCGKRVDGHNGGARAVVMTSNRSVFTLL